jgi:3-oxoacyl-[acyl-carrier-protein] synthase-3
MDGVEVFSSAVKAVPSAVNALCEKYFIEKDSIDYFLIHQANKFMCEKIRKKLNISLEKTPYNIKDYGNTSGATIPLLMVTDLSDELRNRELNLLLATVGVGFSYGGANILTKGNIICPETVTSPMLNKDKASITNDGATEHAINVSTAKNITNVISFFL